MVLAKSCFYDNTIKGYVRACKPWQYLQGSPSQKSLLEVYNVGFLIWVFINCQSRVRIPGFSSYVRIVMVYITLFYFHAFADGQSNCHRAQSSSGSYGFDIMHVRWRHPTKRCHQRRFNCQVLIWNTRFDAFFVLSGQLPTEFKHRY